MRTLVVFLFVLITHNNGFAGSKCQDFVREIFNQYNLPLPGTSKFPSHGSFNLEKFDQSMPEFTIATTPREIKKESRVAEKAKLTTRKDHLVFFGKVMKDGTYHFGVSEVRPEPKRNKGDNYIYKIYDKPQPVIHRFAFSKSCKFNGYIVGQSPPVFSMNKDGFRVSADKDCKFDEPAPQGKALTAHKVGMKKVIKNIIERSYSKSDLLRKDTKRVDDYMILEYPDYYRGLCELAKTSTTDEVLSQPNKNKKVSPAVIKK